MNKNSKLYYSITEVSDIMDVPKHTLRYWQDEHNIKIHKNRAGNRAYRLCDIQRMKQIKTLRCDDEISHKGVSKLLKQGKLLRQGKLKQQISVSSIICQLTDIVSIPSLKRQDIITRLEKIIKESSGE